MSWRTRNFFFRLFRPSWWVQNKPTDWHWDYVLRGLLDDGDVRDVSPYHAKVGPFSLWIANYPYAFGYPEGWPYGLPAPLTRKRLKREITEAMAREIRSD